MNINIQLGFVLLCNSRGEQFGDKTVHLFIQSWFLASNQQAFHYFA